jgi:hypothetical protein
MTDDELIAKARDYAARIQPESLDFLTLDQLPRTRIRHAVEVSFLDDEENPHIRIVLDRTSGDFLSGHHLPKQKD